mmetsp:Transcript_3049/g.4362  ORF Transcript_3049/g.4362 Transcript_3049/m.4362 type:complete len:173 (-) Transcript_3049:190-708(-)
MFGVLRALVRAQPSRLLGAAEAQGCLRRRLIVPSSLIVCEDKMRLLSTGTGMERKKLHNSREEGIVWKQVRNAQGRVFFENMETGARSWEAPKGEDFLTLAQIEEDQANEREDLSVDSDFDGGKKKAYKGDSIIMRVVDSFWTVVDLARKTYWVGIVAAAIYVAYELFDHYN